MDPVAIQPTPRLDPCAHLFAVSTRSSEMVPARSPSHKPYLGIESVQPSVQRHPNSRAASLYLKGRDFSTFTLYP